MGASVPHLRIMHDAAFSTPGSSVPGRDSFASATRTRAQGQSMQLRKATDDLGRVGARSRYVLLKCHGSHLVATDANSYER